MNHPDETKLSSRHAHLARFYWAKLHEEYEHVNFIEVNALGSSSYMVIEKADGDLDTADLVLEGRGSYAFVEDYAFDDEAAARARCEAYERDWRSLDRAYAEFEQRLTWWQFLAQPADVQAIAQAYGIFENTILDFIDQLAATRSVREITNGGVIAVIEASRAQEVVIRHGSDSLVTTRPLPCEGECPPARRSATSCGQ